MDGEDARNQAKKQFKMSESFHKFTYGQDFATGTFESNKEEIFEFIKNFLEIKKEDIQPNLLYFLNNCKYIDVNYNSGETKMANKNYHCRMESYLLSLTLLMASKEELEKLTVAQIREKLKSRKLPASGPKSELVTRLFDSLMAEEKLLEEGPGGESIDLSGVNMDEVLGLDDEKDTHSSTTANEDIEEGKEKQPASCDNSDESIKNNDEEKGANKTDEDKKEEEIKGKLITREDQSKRKGTTDEDVKMLKLAERVGLPVKRRVSESESDDILTKREKRFGSFSGNKVFYFDV
ncbi:unnamed protein product [Meloidogyne enterolobii]|uniref:Uncharacterized protein n=1 Tax=Meloidogyne enterolobii TaxID=390850 RepID=A0ACB0ZKN0_MELEN